MVPTQGAQMKSVMESEKETDGRRVAEVLELPGVMAYGQTREEALNKIYAGSHKDKEVGKCMCFANIS